MTAPEGPEVEVFATGKARQRSRRAYILILKLTLLPLLMIMGFLSGSLLADVGVPPEFGRPFSLVLGPGLPWLALRALNRSSRFWFALHPDRLEVGPARYGWRVPYEQVALIRETFSYVGIEERSGRHLEVVAGPRSAKVILGLDDERSCAVALFERCPCAVWVDDRGKERLPIILEEDPTSELGRRAAGNLTVLRGRYARVTVLFGGILLASLAGLVIVAGSYLGIVPLEEEGRRGLAITSMLFALRFGIYWWAARQHWRNWDRLCAPYTGSTAPVEREVDDAPWWEA